MKKTSEKRVIKNMKMKIIVIILFLFIGTVAYSKPMNIGFTVGLAVPNDDISQFYHYVRDSLKVAPDSTRVGDYLLDNATSVGYILGIKGRIELTNRFDLALGIGLARFNDAQYSIVPAVGSLSLDTSFAKIQSTTNIVPISAGINAYLLRSFINLYVIGDVTYNYISYSYDIVLKNKPGIPITNSTSDSRLGYSFGAGLDFDLSLFKINLETKFNAANIIGRVGDEKQKNYGTITVGIIF